MKKFALSGSIIGLVLLGAGAGSGVVVAAEDFQNEVGVQRFHLKEDGGGKLTQNLLGFGHYFRPVSTEGKPLNEAAFLDRVGGVEAVLADAEYTGSFDADIDAFGIEATLARKDIPWVLELSYIQQDVKYTAPANADLDYEGYQLAVGYFIKNGLLVSGLYGRADGNLSGAAVNDIKETNYGLEVNWVQLLSLQTAFKLEASVERDRIKDDFGTDNGQQMLVSGTYYFTPAAGAGLSFSKRTHDIKSREGVFIGIEAQLFVTPQFSIEADVGQFDADSSVSGENEDRWKLGLAYRF